MKKKAAALTTLILLSQLFSYSPAVSEARAETRVTITFAAGGVACGVFFFLQFALRSSLTDQSFRGNDALVNHGPEGWRIEIPTLNYSWEERRSRISLSDSPETVQMNLLQLRF